MGKLKNIILNSVLLFVPIAGQAGISQAEIKDKMISDLDVIQQTFEVNYAPKDWKKTFTDWDLREQIEKAKIKVLEKERITLKDYQYIVRDFFNSTKDYHVGVSFCSTEVAALPFRVASANGKYYITWAMQNKQWDPEMDFQLEVGDEVLLFNNQPIDQLVQEFKMNEFGNPDSLTDQALAEAELTLRTGLRGKTVPQGPVQLTVRKKGSKKVETYTLQWAYLPEKVSDNFVNVAKQPKDIFSKNQPLGQHPFFQKDMTTPEFALQKSASKLGLKALKTLRSPETEDDDEDEEDDGFGYLGLKKSFVPVLGKTIWKSDPNSNIDAYIYLSPAKKRIGYFRIPSFMLGDHDAEELVKIISLFQQRTDALVIDQLNNPGGNLWFMYALVSMLSDKPMAPPKEQMMISSHDIFFALQTLDELDDITSDEDAMELLGKSLGGLPVNHALVQGLIRHFNFILSEWYEGRMFTQSEYLYGIDYIQPHPMAQYTKPIMVLVNSLDFSCGDFFPAILQDNNRATIVGTQTAGAGGFVIGHEFTNIFGIGAFRFTGSIAERINSNPIENLGVTPDVWLEMTEKDLEFNYVNYIKEVNKLVDNLAK